MKGMVLAPTQSQRLKYQDWLHVYAKDLTALSRRMGSLLSEYKVCAFHSAGDNVNHI